MFINDVSNSHDLHCAVIQELRSHGIKYRLKKSNSKVQQNNGVIFGAALDSVSHQVVNCCEAQLKVPNTVYDACNMLSVHVNIEGLFRKAGSQSRQKEIRRALDIGSKIDKSSHAIDIASILKLYLRALPEPIIGHDLQEVFLRCLLLPDAIKLLTIQNALLLLPVRHIHMLHYVMEFFKFVSSKSDTNKMDAHNLAVVIAPSIMPPPQSYPPQRMEHHVNFIKLLIENAHMIGKVREFPQDNVDSELEEQRIRKKRRSGSLTRMLSGLRKIVTGNTANTAKAQTPDALCTPVLNKGMNKRKQELQAQGMSAKKRKEIMDTLSEKTFTCTPVRPMNNKEHKKLRLSIGRKSKEKLVDFNPPQRMTFNDKKPITQNEKEEPRAGSLFTTESTNSQSQNKESDYVRISKSEYEAIKNRVSAIENSISNEFKVMTAINDNGAGEPVMQVQTAYEKTLEEAAMLASPGSEQLARRLSRELKIRTSGEHKIIRSPSARKIGTIRRRSRENVTKLTRTQTWNVHSKSNPQPVVVRSNQFYPNVSLKRGRPNTIHTGLHQPSPHFVNANGAVEASPGSKRRVSFNEQTNQNNVNNMPSTNHAYFTRNHFKRASSFHGQSVLENANLNVANERTEDNCNSSKWKSASSFITTLENLSNPLTGRASVAKLRSQNVGMVLAKARLFDGMTDSDSSMEKKIDPKPSRIGTGFARKPRKMTVPDVPKKVYPNSSLDSTDSFISGIESKLVKKNYKSPGYVSKRGRSRIVRSPVVGLKTKENLNLSKQLKDVIYDVCTPLSEKLNCPTNEENKSIKETNRNVNAFKTPRKTPPIKKPLSVKSTKIAKTPNAGLSESRRMTTPMRANHNTPRRQSPRFVSIKTRQLI